MTQKQINSVGHKCSRVVEQWMSGAVAVFININMLCKATVSSGCDVITPLRHQFSQASSSLLLVVITLQRLLLCFSSARPTLTPDAVTVSNYTRARLSSCFQCGWVLKLSVQMHLTYLTTEPSLLLADQVENLPPRSSSFRGSSAFHLQFGTLSKLLWFKKMGP